MKNAGQRVNGKVAIVIADGQEFEAEATLRNAPSRSFDALALPDGEQAVTRLASDGHTIDLLKEQYRHGKIILVGSASAHLLTSAGMGTTLPSGECDPRLILCSPTRFANQIGDFLAAVGRDGRPEVSHAP
jgi:catalase